MSTRPKSLTFSSELKLFTIGAERPALLGDLVTTARADLKPRNFAERHLVDELAISKWRGLSRRPDGEGRLRAPKHNLSPSRPERHRRQHAHTPESHAVVLAALSRLDSRYARQFCTALRLLIALRRGDPPPVPEATSTEPKPLTGKESQPCEPSPITQPTT